ncbi:VWA domain-containing protein [Acidipila sp. EB88]|nr:VWA domain-containing protein [Acidipila sp. EB88]
MAVPAQGAQVASQAAPPPAAAPAQSQTSASAPVMPAEVQQPLDVERDPVRSPDEADNAAVKPGAGVDAGAAASQSADISKSDGRYTLRRDVQEVVLNATVLDDQGHLVNDLAKDDFHVFEDGVPQTLASFQHTDTPVSMGILVDNSGSMRAKRGAVNAAALDLVRASNPQDEAFIVNFSDEAFIDQDFTSDLNKLRDGLAHYDSKGGTALYDAAVASADELSKGAKRPKQVILIITDGEDNASGLTLEQTIRRVQDLQGPIVYCIGLLFGDDGGGHEAKQAKRALQLLAQETGGIAYFPRALGDVDAIADEVAKDIRSQYTLGYHSTKPAALGGFRQVKVMAHPNGGKKSLNVRTRSGYYPKTAAAGAPETAAQGSK